MTETGIKARAIMHIPLDQIDENPGNARTHSWQIGELAASVKKLGVMTPCLVRRVGERYQLISGHRRLRAARVAGLTHVPCILLSVNDADLWVVALTENVQRQQLNPIEEARAYKGLREQGLTILAIANRLSCSEQRVSRRLALLDLSEENQEAVLSGRLTIAEAWEMHPAGRPGPKRRSHHAGRTTKYNEHFNGKHSLAERARELCERSEDPVSSRLGPACAACWEEVIRDDQMAIDDQLNGEEMEGLLTPEQMKKWLAQSLSGYASQMKETQ